MDNILILSLFLFVRDINKNYMSAWLEEQSSSLLINVVDYIVKDILHQSKKAIIY